jgi:hypothetical protein
MSKYNKRNKTLKHRNKFDTQICDDKMTFQDCEMAILRQSIKDNEKTRGRKIVSNEDIQKIIKIVENFIIKKKLVCYGGTAINNILPEEAQFYDKESEIPDYDFFSSNALDDAIELADIYYGAGYIDVEAKAGMHHGTYKVYVNFIPIADITQLVKPLFNSIKKQSIKKAGIHYTPPNYLRMSMYLELSRPEGDISRWEKVLKRLNLLNKYYPLTADNCDKIDFQRKLDTHMDDNEKIYTITRDVFVDEGLIFFGGYASGLYSKYDDKRSHKMMKIPDFDVLSDDPERTALILKEQLEEAGIKHIKVKHNDKIGEVVPENYEVIIGKEDTIAMIHKPIACHSYNQLTIGGRKINVASIDTIMSLYLCFIYVDSDLHAIRLLCMAKYLFDIQERNKLNQKGILKRFVNKCYGTQETIESIRSEKSNKYKELKSAPHSREYQEWFLKYTPGEKSNKAKTKKILQKEDKPTKGNKILKILGL